VRRHPQLVWDLLDHYGWVSRERLRQGWGPELGISGAVLSTGSRAAGVSLAAPAFPPLLVLLTAAALPLFPSRPQQLLAALLLEHVLLLLPTQQ